MPNAFNFSASPFDCLAPDEQALVRGGVDIAYFPEGAVVLDVGSAPTHLFVIIKGHVVQTEGDEVLATYGPDDSFDGRALVAGRASSRFTVAEELVAYQLAHATVNELIARNAAFGALLFSDLGHKLGTLAQRAQRHERQSLTLERVDQAYLRPAHVVDAATDIVSVARLFQAERTTSVLVSGLEAGLGIFTATTLQRAVLDGRALDRLAVGEFASCPVVTVRASDQLGDAMVLLLRARVHRLAVLGADGQVMGILEALDLFSFLANHSHLITVQIEQAQDLQALEQAAGQVTRLVAALHRGGTRVGLMARLVQQLNARLFERAWQMLAPAELVAHSCLFVMGSEGRGEQLLKTDQDNGLLLRDGYVPPENLDAICRRFSEVLQRFGYPECPGRIMLSNPAWRGSASDFGRRVREWLVLPGPEGLMHLAIFLDAQAVAGDAALLAGVRQGLVALATDNDALIARFASAINAFGEAPGHWWSRLLVRGDEDSTVHLKKAGIFPIVHGVRSLALAHHITATGTAERIAALVAEGVLDEALGRELLDGLHLLMGLRLQAGLAEMALDRPVTGHVDPARLGSLERDLLKDTLAVVRRFKALLRQRLRLDLV
ncbi:Predicted signal-transduction protein containing cAMP-binding and CBS domains [Delftia tsuruhatensis]|uniref:putative nucleotidyltransferase substrate binding domain-containing protein n=1 Tax=Delftia tsuruhatensis TaxID=180282 RepID=UPI001E773846|nr:putative nucleotidyltransferase substrate binding domain-containing protein [Delftia tsuruhatensis]CAB5715208.1 Predicted signal-transduction protein containing cAMP-binding and CBS domains [Delftia tsuruhatensis]CAC9676670.1 Predicted signal-transduction protein containing cAMP-binding and CBS domains [Delftia tsuruhatensis]